MTWQLHGAREESFIRADRVPLNPETLSCEARRVGGVAFGAKVVLVSFFSLAELQFLPAFDEGSGFFVGPRGSLDCKFETSSGPIEVVDIARWFDGQSLASAADVFGMKKLEWERGRVSAADLSRAGFRDYAMNDARLARAIKLKLREEFAAMGADTLASKTPAGISSRIYRASYLERDLEPPTRAVRGAALRAAWGGRAEVFVRGRHELVREFDFTSAYPEAVKSFGVFPTAADWTPTTNWRAIERAKGGVLRGFFRFPAATKFPCLPVFDRGLLLFPLRGLCSATRDEFLLARRLGARVDLVDGHVFDAGLLSPAAYQSELVERRATAVGARRVALKLLANAWTGKLAQAVRRVDLERMRRVATKYGIRLRELGAMSENERAAFLSIRDAPPEDVRALAPSIEVGSLYLPEWYALITGRVRAWLGELLVTGAPVYCATDAFWTPLAMPAPAGTTMKRKGPATTVRSKLAAIWCRPAHLAMHGVAKVKAARKLLRAFSGKQEVRVGYRIRRPVKVYESLLTGRRLGSWLKQSREAVTFWDNKRRLLRGKRDTIPWLDLDEFRDAEG